MMEGMFPLIFAASMASKMQGVPTSVWLKIGAAVLALIVLVIVLRKVAKMNKIVLGIVVFLVVTIIGFNWIYERNEPSWATPVIDPISKFLPTKDSMK
jgi:apolipoprotein N-acyltransferase